MKNFTQLIKENKETLTRPLLARIETKLKEIYESEALFLEEKLNEFGFECNEHRCIVKNGYKSKARIIIFFQAQDGEYALVDELETQEFSLHSVIIKDDRKQLNVIIHKSNTLENTIRSLVEKFKNKKTINFYIFDNPPHITKTFNIFYFNF